MGLTDKVITNRSNIENHKREQVVRISQRKYVFAASSVFT
jgi:hypothetical protein